MPYGLFSHVQWIISKFWYGYRCENRLKSFHKLASCLVIVLCRLVWTDFLCSLKFFKRSISEYIHAIATYKDDPKLSRAYSFQRNMKKWNSLMSPIIRNCDTIWIKHGWQFMILKESLYSTYLPTYIWWLL